MSIVPCGDFPTAFLADPSLALWNSPKPDTAHHVVWCGSWTFCHPLGSYTWSKSRTIFREIPWLLFCVWGGLVTFLGERLDLGPQFHKVLSTLLAKWLTCWAWEHTPSAWQSGFTPCHCQRIGLWTTATRLFLKGLLGQWCLENYLKNAVCPFLWRWSSFYPQTKMNLLELCIYIVWNCLQRRVL